MDLLYRIPFTVLEIPHLKLRKPSFVKVNHEKLFVCRLVAIFSLSLSQQAPSSMVVYGMVLFSYFLVTGGIIYDVIVEPPSIGSTTDEYGHSRPVAFMQYRVNGQYIMEGLASSFLFTMGGLGFVILERSNAVGYTRLNRSMLFAFGFFCVVAAFFTCRIFMTMKLP